MSQKDKGLVLLRGRPLVQWVVDRLQPQVSEVLLSANRNLERYAALGLPVVRDRQAGFLGPLAGMQAGLAAATHPLVVFAPCDCPLLPSDLVSRLREALESQRQPIAVAQAPGRLHPVVCLVRRGVLASLEAFVNKGGRKVEAWRASTGYAVAAFEHEAAFRNINTPRDLSALERELAPGPA